MARKERKKHRRTGWIIILCLIALMLIAALIFTHFGGFGTGDSADVEEFGKYAGTIADIAVPDNAAIVALGEATHGNKEFQQLKLDVFRHLVENYGVRALALEGDCGGCAQVDRYIHGGAGTAREAAAAIGFAIYRTDEMAALISYMRDYNRDAAEGEDLRFYGFDMQRCGYNLKFLAEACRELGVDCSELEKLADGENWNAAYDTAARTDIIAQAKAGLESRNASAETIHYADVLLQNCALQPAVYENGDDYAMLRDKYMAENTLWISEREQERGHGRIFVTAHNGHVARWGSCDQMGKLLADALGDDYYVIGTDFYKTRCNMPAGRSGRRTNQTFYSYDPLAKAARLAGYELCWLDFDKIPADSALAGHTTGYRYMGTLGEGYSLLMRLLPPSYRMFQPPAELYNGMIFVTHAHPTKILDEE